MEDSVDNTERLCFKTHTNLCIHNIKLWVLKWGWGVSPLDEQTELVPRLKKASQTAFYAISLKKRPKRLERWLTS